MIKVKDGYAKLIGTTYQGSATQVLLSNGGNLEFSSATKANTLVQRNASQHIYATYFNSAISDEALTDIGSVYVRNTSDTFIRRISKTQFYSIIDGRYVGGNKTANHGSSGTAYTADTYSSTFVNKAFVAFAERGSWSYANNGYVSTDTGVNIPLAGTAIFQWGASDTNKTQLYITPHDYLGVSNPAANEMLFYTSNGSGYTSAWTRVLTHRNYTNYTVTKTGGGASGTWGISITGNAATANRILSHTISDTLANKTTPGYLYHAGSSNSVADKPSGVDAFGVFTMQTASGWYGQILMSSNTSTGLYWRTATTLSGGWKKILDSSNYTAYINPANFVTALGTSGNYLTWTKNGVVNNLTVPYSSYSGYLQSHDTRSTNNTPAQFSSGARFEFKYNSTDGLSNGGTYHGILHFKPYGGTTDFSGGQTHQLGFTDGGNLYMRTSTSSSAWGSWKLILTQTTADGRYVTSLGTNGNYLTWTKAGTTNNITVPYATNSNKANYIYYGSISNLNSPSSWTSDGYRLVYDTYSDSASNKPVSKDNANGIITLFKSKHGTSNQYVSQLAFPNDTRMYFRYASAGSFSSWYTIAYTSDIKDPANYYWANVKVSASSSTATQPTFNTCYTSNWFRSQGGTGWYNQSYAGGVYMNENYWVKTYGGTMMYIAPDAHAWGIGGHNIAMKLYHSSHIGINFATSAYTWGIYANSNGNMYIGRRTGNVNDDSGTYYHTLTASYISSPGFYHSAIGSNSYVLLAGGSYKGLGDFAKGNAGSATKGVYVTGGTVTAMTYSLSSNLNSGTSGKLA